MKLTVQQLRRLIAEEYKDQSPEPNEHTIASKFTDAIWNAIGGLNLPLPTGSDSEQTPGIINSYYVGDNSGIAISVTDDVATIMSPAGDVLQVSTNEHDTLTRAGEAAAKAVRKFIWHKLGLDMLSKSYPGNDMYAGAVRKFINKHDIFGDEWESDQDAHREILKYLRDTLKLRSKEKEKWNPADHDSDFEEDPYGALGESKLTLRRLKKIIAEELELHAVMHDLSSMSPEEAYGLGYYAGKEQGDLDTSIDELVKPGRGGFRIDKPESVKGYWRHDKDGNRVWVGGHKSESDTLAMEYTPEAQDEEVTNTDIDEKKRAKSRKKKKSKPKTYHASAGSVAALRDSGGSCETAIKDGKFDWAGKGKWAACQSAHIVSTGKPTVQKGSKFVGGDGPHGGGEGSHMVKPRKRRKSKKK